MVFVMYVRLEGWMQDEVGSSRWEERVGRKESDERWRACIRRQSGCFR